MMSRSDMSKSITVLFTYSQDVATVPPMCAVQSTVLSHSTVIYLSQNILFDVSGAFVKVEGLAVTLSYTEI